MRLIKNKVIVESLEEAIESILFLFPNTISYKELSELISLHTNLATTEMDILMYYERINKVANDCRD